jgi:glutathione S-transferase
MYTLYYSPGTASMVIHLALQEIGAEYSLERVDFDKDAQHSAAYLKLNPHGHVPALIVDGRPCFESVALLIMLGERYPDSKLLPLIGTPAHDTWLQWAVYLSNALMSTYRFWFYPHELGSEQHDPAIRAALQRKIEGVWDRLEAHLAANGPYMLGEEFSGIDLLLTMLMRWSRNMPRPATQWPSLKHLADLVRVRPSWKRVYELEGLSEW